MEFERYGKRYFGSMFTSLKYRLMKVSQKYIIWALFEPFVDN